MRVSKADGAIQVATASDLDETQAGMLFVLRAKAAISWAPVHHICAESEGELARLVVGQGIEIHLGVGTHQRLEPAVSRTPFSHDDSAVCDKNFSIHNAQAFWTHTTGRLTSDVVGVTFSVSHHILTAVKL